MFAGLFFLDCGSKKSLLGSFGGVGGVGQIGGGVALGRKNGSTSGNTERSRRGFLKKFENI